MEEWPKKSAKEVATDAKESIDKLQKKAFVAALTRTQAKGNQGTPTKITYRKEPLAPESRGEVKIHRSPAGSAVKLLVDERRFSSLTKLVSYCLDMASCHKMEAKRYNCWQSKVGGQFHQRKRPRPEPDRWYCPPWSVKMHSETFVL